MYENLFDHTMSIFVYKINKTLYLYKKKYELFSGY